MENDLVILPCARKHGLSDDDMRHAWENALAIRARNYDPPCHVAVAGPDVSGRVVEMLVAEQEDGAYIVYHAMKITAKMARELGLR